MDAHTPAKHPPHGSAPSTPATARPQGPLEIQDPGDCLALVKHTFGTLPRESLIVVGLLDGYTGGHMRIDLHPALREPFASARLIADCLAGEGSAPAPEAALVVLLGDDPPSPEQDQAWRSCLDALRMMLESEYCVRIVQAWFISAGHVRDPLCADPGCCALPGRRIADLSVPALGGLPGGSARHEARPLEQAAAAFLRGAPRTDPELDLLVAESRLQDQAHGDSRELMRRLQTWDVALRQRVASGEQASHTGPTAPLHSAGPDGTDDELRAQAQRLVELLGQLHRGTDRDLLIPLATLGLQHVMLALRRDQGRVQGPADPAEERLLQDYAASFLGETGSRPDWDRVDALESVLSELVPYARGAEREHLLCLMAWVEWARGRGTAAGSFIDRCLQEFPDNEFSRLIEHLMQLRGVCLWARVKQHSWSWARSSTTGLD